MKKAPLYFILFYILWCLSACGNGAKGDNAKDDSGKSDGAKSDSAKSEAADSADTGTPVTVTTVTNAPFNDSIELNAVSAFLQKSYVKANANGYLQTADVYPGKYVEAGQTLFTLKTKEAQSIGNTISQLDSTLHFSGVNTIRAGQHG